MIEKICIVGGDMRQIQLAKMLSNDGFSVECFALSQNDCDIRQLKCADAVILPIPVSRDDIYINTPLSAVRIAVRVSPPSSPSS